MKFAADGIPAPSRLDPADASVVDQCAALAASCFASVDFESLPSLPKAVLDMATRLNAHVDAVAPWKLARDPASKERLDSVILALLESLRLLGELAWPVMPQTSDRILTALGVGELAPTETAHEFVPFRLVRGGPIVPPVRPLFPRVRVELNPE